MSPARIKAFTRHFEHMFIQYLSAHPLMLQCTADTTRCIYDFLPDKQQEAATFKVFKQHSKDSFFSWFSLFFTPSQ